MAKDSNYLENFSPLNDGIPKNKIPFTESLKHTYDRVVPFYNFEIKKNIMVLREDILNNWKWTSEIYNQLQEIKLENKAILEMVKKNEQLFYNKTEDLIQWDKIKNNTY